MLLASWCSSEDGVEGSGLPLGYKADELASLFRKVEGPDRGGADHGAHSLGMSRSSSDRRVALKLVILVDGGRTLVHADQPP